MDLRQKINEAFEQYGVAILPPMDVFDSFALLSSENINAACVMLDPWYNKGIGGKIPSDQYDEFIVNLLDKAGKMSHVVYLWGFPEIIGPYVRNAPKGFSVTAWLTWFYKNCPSVIRGWRSSQNACIQYTRQGYNMHPEHFLNEEQKSRMQSGKMRFIPGPSSVIEEPLIVGFVGKKERTGHPSQKPEAVYNKLILMATCEEEVIFDPMAGSGTTASCALKNNRKSIVCDKEEEYIQLMEKRTGAKRITI